MGSRGGQKGRQEEGRVLQAGQKEKGGGNGRFQQSQSGNPQSAARRIVPGGGEGVVGEGEVLRQGAGKGRVASGSGAQERHVGRGKKEAG